MGIGGGVRTNPIQYSSDIPLILLPQVNYSSGNFFIDNLDLGLHLYEDKRQQINLLVTPSYDQVFFHRWNSGNFFLESTPTFATVTKNQNQFEEPKSTEEPIPNDQIFVRREHQLHDRHMTALGGLEYNLQLASINVQLQWLHDVLGEYEGQEVRLALGREWQRNRHTVNLSGGLIWQDENTINYYYGVRPGEVAENDIYQPGASISPMLRFDWHYRLTEKWDLRFLGSYRHLDNEISKSPIADDNKIITLFVGGVYHF